MRLFCVGGAASENNAWVSAVVTASLLLLGGDLYSVTVDADVDSMVGDNLFFS